MLRPACATDDLLLLGALFARRLIFDEPVTDEFIDALINRVLPG